MKTVTFKTAMVMLSFPLALIFSIATKTAQDMKPADHFGFRKVGGICVQTDVLCSDVYSGVICRDASNNVLYKGGITDCPQQLFKPL